MSEQGLLFDPERPGWIDRLWEKIGPAERRKIVSLLAQLAQPALDGGAAGPVEEPTDES